MARFSLNIRELVDLAEKTAAITACDGAFDNPVTGRENYPILLDKIHRNAIFFAAEADVLMGYAAMYANDFESRTAFLTLLAVKPESQRKGVGKQLIGACIDKAKACGMRSIRLEVKKDNLFAIRLYEQQGFTLTNQETPKSFFMQLDLEKGSRLGKD